MKSTLAEIEVQALQLSPQERRELASRLIVSLDQPANDTPETIAKAWEEEIARRVGELEARTTELIPHEQVYSEVDDMLRTYGN